MQPTRLLLASLLLASCGTGDPVTPDAGALAADALPAAQRYLPLATGNSWTYRVSDPAGGPPEQKTSTIEALEDVGGTKAGVIAFRVLTEKLDGSTTSWQEDLGDRVVRHHEIARDLAGAVTSEETYDPAKLRLDESAAHLVVGASWSDVYTEISTDPVTGATTPVTKTEAWSVVAVDESVTVPAGTFSCLRVRRMGSAVGQSDKTYYFARGVGKVKETGGQTEELVSSSLLP
ncbi:MAG: hypothetical protein EXR73_11920 [Myxococcales bacterium]|nr:hypothetical protein [Myxococcales bacterium]